jgi:hypothetical protein
MSRLDPAAALRAGAAAIKAMSPHAEVGNPKVKVLVVSLAGTGPEPPCDAERSLAAAGASSPEQRAAREKVIRDFYQNRMGLGAPRCGHDLKDIDLDEPVAVMQLVPGTLLMMIDSPESGNYFLPLSTPSMPASCVGQAFVVTEAFDALRCTMKGAGQLLVIDDANRDHKLRN